MCDETCTMTHMSCYKLPLNHTLDYATISLLQVVSEKWMGNHGSQYTSTTMVHYYAVPLQHKPHWLSMDLWANVVSAMNQD